MLKSYIVLISVVFLVFGCNKNLTEEEKKELWNKAQTTGEIINRSGTPFNSATDKKLAMDDAQNRLITGGGLFGKKASLNEKKQGIKKKLVVMTIDTKDIDVSNDEAILKDNKCVGYVTSGGYAHHSKKSMALGYVPIELSKHNTSLDVEINGNLYKAHVTDRPLYDANGGKMKS